MKGLKELENTILDQIEKLNDDSIGEDKDKTMIIVERSKAISELTSRFVELNRLKLDVVKELNSNGDMYKNYLGIESEK